MKVKLILTVVAANAGNVPIKRLARLITTASAAFAKRRNVLVSIESL
jgi:hypothetical protein